jgi:hypothetical protein
VRPLKSFVRPSWDRQDRLLLPPQQQKMIVRLPFRRVGIRERVRGRRLEDGASSSEQAKHARARPAAHAAEQQTRPENRQAQVRTRVRSGP